MGWFSSVVSGIKSALDKPIQATKTFIDNPTLENFGGVVLGAEASNAQTFKNIAGSTPSSRDDALAEKYDSTFVDNPTVRKGAGVAGLVVGSYFGAGALAGSSGTAAGAGSTSAAGAGAAASGGVTFGEAAKAVSTVYSLANAAKGSKNVPAVPTPDLGAYFADDSIRAAENPADASSQSPSVIALDNGSSGSSNWLWLGLAAIAGIGAIAALTKAK